MLCYSKEPNPQGHQEKSWINFENSFYVIDVYSFLIVLEIGLNYFINLVVKTYLPNVFDTPIKEITKLALDESILRSIIIISGR